jgi:hypothetical protein
MTVRRRPILPADERYKGAIEALRVALGNGTAFDFAKTWALDECRKAERYDWSVNNRFEKTWAGASAAARKLADHLEQGGDFGTIKRISEAEKDIGMRLRFKSKEPDGPVNAAKTPARAEMEQRKVTAAMFPRLLRALSKQPVPPRRPPLFRRRTRFVYDEGMQFIYGPLIFGGTEERTKRPSRTTTLAIALTHGFRVISEAVDDSMPTAVEPLMRFKRQGGKPCYAAAEEFANATFQDDKKTSLDAITKYLSRNGSGLRFWGFSTGPANP